MDTIYHGKLYVASMDQSSSPHISESSFYIMKNLFSLMVSRFFLLFFIIEDNFKFKYISFIFFPFSMFLQILSTYIPTQL